MTDHPELPFPTEPVSFALTREQHLLLLPLVRKQTTSKKGLLCVSIAPFIRVENGETKLRLQAIFLEQKTATKVLRAIRGNEPKT